MPVFCVRKRGSAGVIAGLLFALGALLYVGEDTAARDTGLSGQLANLSKQHNFPIAGLERVGDEPSVRLDGNLFAQIARLLANYNYVVIRDPQAQGGIRRLIILNRKQPAPQQPDRIVIPTQRQGVHHLVETRLFGLNGEQISVTLTIDTGASFVVLPLSVSSDLGFEVEQLEPQELHTANGNVDGLMGVLPKLQLGDESVSDVEVVFLDDREQDGVSLLGMGVLGRYRMTLDDENDVLILQRD